jgi:hypothetical protein
MFTAIDIISAQTLDFQTIPNNRIQFCLSFKKTFYPTNRDMSTFSGVYQLNANIPVGNIPYINTSFDIDYPFGHYSYSRSGLGNIFIGLQTKPQIMEKRRSTFTFGLFLPTASETASLNGALADYYYFSKYIFNSLGLHFNYAYHYIPADGFNYGLEIGPNLLVATESNSETEFFMHYGFTGGYQINKLLFNIEVIGVVMVSEDIGNLGDRFVNMINIGMEWRETAVTPKIFYKYYLRDDISRTIDGVLGVGVSLSND